MPPQEQENTATKLSRVEYDWWCEKTSLFLGKKVSSIKLFKDEVGVGDVYYKKSDITHDEPPVALQILSE